MSVLHLYGTTRHERRLLTACARCGPIPAQVAHCYFYLPRRALEGMRERGLVQYSGAYPISPSVQHAFRLGGRALPKVAATYAATIPALEALVRADYVENWQRISGVAPTAHHLRLLATYLQAPRPVRATWLCEREVLDTWFRVNGVTGRSRGRGRRRAYRTRRFWRTGTGWRWRFSTTSMGAIRTRTRTRRPSWRGSCTARARLPSRGPGSTSSGW